MELPPPCRNFQDEGRELAAQTAALGSSLQGETAVDPCFICPAHSPMYEENSVSLCSWVNTLKRLFPADMERRQLHAVLAS